MLFEFVVFLFHIRFGYFTPTNCVFNGFWIKQADIEVPDHYFCFWAIQPKNNSPLCRCIFINNGDPNNNLRIIYNIDDPNQDILSSEIAVCKN